MTEDVEIILIPDNFSLIPCSSFREEVENVSANQRLGRPSWISARKHHLGRGRWDLASCQISFNSVHGVKKKSRKCSANQRSGRPFRLFSNRLEKAYRISGIIRVGKFWRKWRLVNVLNFHWVLFSLFQVFSMKTYSRVYFSLRLFLEISERSRTQQKLNPREKNPDIRYTW